MKNQDPSIGTCSTLKSLLKIIILLKNGDRGAQN